MICLICNGEMLGKELHPIHRLCYDAQKLRNDLGIKIAVLTLKDRVDFKNREDVWEWLIDQDILHSKPLVEWKDVVTGDVWFVQKS
jgi:hypothetical protein